MPTPSVEVLVPNASDVGPNTMTGATPHWSRVDENPGNGDTDFVSFAGAGTSEAFGLNGASVIPKGSAVLSVRIRIQAKGSTGGASTIKFGYRFGGISYWGTDRGPPPSSYGSFQDIYTLNQGTGGLFEERFFRTTPNIFALRAEWVTPSGLIFPAPRLSQCVLFATIPDPTAPLSEDEIAEFWRIHRLVRRKELFSMEPATDILGERYDYLRDRAYANGQTLLPPQDLLDSNYDPARPTTRRFR